MERPYERERQLAELAVLRAATLTKKVLSNVREISKADASPVTVADFAAQALLIGAVRSVFSGDGFLGEEDAAALREDAELRAWVYELVGSISREWQSLELSVGGGLKGSGIGSPVSEEHMLDLIDLGGKGVAGRKGRFWVMDPVDGTATFLRGQQYAVSLAFIEDGREVLGVLCCPNLKLQDGRVVESSVDREGLGVMLTAVRGQGATIRTLSAGRDASELLPPAHPLPKLAGPKNLSDLHIIDCLESKSSRHDIPRLMAEKLGAQYPGTDVWSSHMRYAALVLGGGDVHLNVPSERASPSYIWDHAGAQLIFTELGGRIMDLDGRETDFGAGRTLSANRGKVAARGDIFDEIFKLTKELIGE